MTFRPFHNKAVAEMHEKEDQWRRAEQRRRRAEELITRDRSPDRQDQALRAAGYGLAANPVERPEQWDAQLPVPEGWASGGDGLAFTFQASAQPWPYPVRALELSSGTVVVQIGCVSATLNEWRHVAGGARGFLGEPVPDKWRLPLERLLDLIIATYDGRR